ncbi:MAG: 23S rRNA (uracil(1939)-C(5))-methyltransferase RlmD [Gammaproteobacteria bacterium]|nr:23S rRNA (uracil(1939)-C(5))-methyltransferase RlmD [Gammaproteobacteria bacterium]
MSRKRFPRGAPGAGPDAEPQLARIDTLNDDGRGVARVDGKVSFIDGALPGELVRYRVLKGKRNFDQGELVEILEASPHRVAPACEHFGVCGGCSLQHLEATAQIAEKERILRDKLRQFGGVEPEHWLPALTGPVWGYRRSARLGVRNVPKKGGIIIGFRERRSSYLTPLYACHTLDARAARLLPALVGLITGLSCRDRIPQLEVACGDDEVALVFRHLEAFTATDLARLSDFGREHGVRVYLQPRGPESVTALEPSDPSPLSYHLPEFEVAIHFRPTDFIQVNAGINRRMVAQAVALLDPRPGETVVDLFCGLGNFTLPLARRAARVTGVEAERRLVLGARDNAARNGIVNAEFRQADLYDEAQARDFWAGASFDKLLIDPPRSGAMEVLKLLPGDGPRRLVYVSCNPATLARDAEYLVNSHGYRLTRAGVMDMFPHTNHVESIAVFEC